MGGEDQTSVPALRSSVGVGPSADAWKRTRSVKSVGQLDWNLVQDIALTLALHLALVLLGVLMIRLRGGTVKSRPLFLGFGLIALYWAASIGGLSLQSALFPELRWNWLGKVFTIASAFAFLAILAKIDRHEVGLVWHQRRGSLLPALLMVGVICAVSWGQAIFDGEASNLSPERVLFEAIMPGLDEELVFRGVLLTLFVQAFGEGRPIFKGRFGISELAITLLFGAAHGLHVSHCIPALDAESFIVTGAIGGALMWIRQRTGSLVLPTLAHNLSNFGECFF
jgi:membrane protease YdiL (CAAX protease family)